MKFIEPEGPDVGDADLLQRVQRGAVEALAPLVRGHVTAILSFLRQQLLYPPLRP